MATAFVLINADIGAEEELLRSLEPIQEAETMEELKNAISWRIRRMDRVRSTLTMIVVE